ncbi:hypothetical protein Q5P01_002152 [Channa striata]|uniref:Uncharacterized protein n=1 Tax=Channa striata TaxID=64152 RepID=A0AA88NQU2_CHASR|nr:hypothetical protein Q5P01_002152 [Channa striata]
MCLRKEPGAAAQFYATVQPSAEFHSEVYVDAVRQIGHALHLCLFLWSERLLPQTEEEEKGASGGGGGGG